MSESSDEDVGQADKDCSSNEPHVLIQGDLSDIVHTLKLSKKQAELKLQVKGLESVPGL
jgi:hypothetical protein